MDYYDEKQYLAAVDQNDVLLRRVEKWEAHRENILHRGYTAIIRYGDEIALQHRKHPVFDNVLDLSFSSHQIYVGDKLQTDEEAIMDGLKREWGMGKSDLGAPPTFITKVYYQAKDEKSGYFEHEIDYIYEVRCLAVPVFKPAFAYGVHLVKRADLEKAQDALGVPFAPWVGALLAAHAV